MLLKHRSRVAMLAPRRRKKQALYLELVILCLIAKGTVLFLFLPHIEWGIQKRVLVHTIKSVAGASRLFTQIPASTNEYLVSTGYCLSM